MDDIVIRAIAAKREDRYQSMDAFAEALRGYLELGSGHASASSMRFEPEGVRPARGRMIESSGLVYHQAPVVKSRRTWIVVLSLLLLVTAVAFLAMQSERDDSATITPKTVKEGQGADLEPAEKKTGDHLLMQYKPPAVAASGDAGPG